MTSDLLSNGRISGPGLERPTVTAINITDGAVPALPSGGGRRICSTRLSVTSADGVSGVTGGAYRSEGGEGTAEQGGGG